MPLPYQQILINVPKYALKCFPGRYIHVSAALQKQDELRCIRNIGILAHIDAGKTTTTERMLYYSGRIDHMGEVHYGNTVTDYLEQERDRGITITSASVTIPWLNHRINIIDTPGHIDFTFEVEQSLKVIDGAVVILDGSAGVEAQTVTVWRQADKYNVPRMVYVNKMDRPDSSFDLCLKSLKSKFNTEFLPLQVPVRGSKSGLAAIVDVVSKNIFTWSGDQGETINRTALTESDNLFGEVQKLRNELVDKLSVLDDELADLVLKENSLSKIGASSIYNALRRVTVNQQGVVVLCGSSYKNIGVQKLLDAVVDILPSPDMRKDLDVYSSFGDNLCAQAFKIVHDQRKGPITFFRIYSGRMSKGQKLFMVNKEKNEQIQQLMIALADDYEEINEVSRGNIAAVNGLKAVCSGDFVTTSNASLKNAVKLLSQKKNISVDESCALLCPPMRIPDPVFFCSIEAPSRSLQSKLDTALEELQKEDPSLRIKSDPDTGQTILGGMGELHLEIVLDRILKKYNVEADTGPLQIAYKESLVTSATDTFSSSISIGQSTNFVKITLSIFPRNSDNQEFIALDKSPENVANTSLVTLKRLSLIKTGIESALQRGPKVGCPVTNARFVLHYFEAKKATTDSVISSTASQCVRNLLSLTQTVLMEPIMSLEVITDEEHMSSVMSDLSRKRAEICEFSTRGKTRVVKAFVPLSELLGYSKSLRIRTSGNANFSMEFSGYKQLTGVHESEAIKIITGFYPD